MSEAQAGRDDQPDEDRRKSAEPEPGAGRQRHRDDDEPDQTNYLHPRIEAVDRRVLRRHRLDVAAVVPTAYGVTSPVRKYGPTSHP